MDAATLQTNEHKDLLDIIDKLRSEGFGKYVDLPQIIVCGDQSAGKSSVLEAISGMSFPTKDNLCTRFATELVLRRHGMQTLKLSIIPGSERSASEREDLRSFALETDAAAPDVGDIVERAEVAMGLSDTKIFSTDILRMELCGPSQPNLTLVDLPGLFRAGNSDQKLQDANVVRSMVQSYVKSPRSIILAIVSAKNDFALQEITEIARKHDPTGTRTLGLITKPDTLDVGSDSESAYVRLAKNKDVKFRLGWHVLKNRNFEMREASSAERDAAEEEFFRDGAWPTVDPSHLGVVSLKPRLAHILRDQILQQIPSLLEDIATEIDDCRTQSQRLGKARSTLPEQRRYLFQISRDFTFLMRCAVNGEYNHDFFSSARDAKGRSRRLRARVQNALNDFAENMRLDGQSRVLVEEPPSDGTDLSGRQILRSDYVREVKQLMNNSRGRELSGTFNPLIIRELFTEQCQPWLDLIKGVKKRILQAMDEVISAIVSYVAADDTVSGIISMISGSGTQIRKDLDRAIDKLLKPHLEVHPITYNHYMTESVQKAQEERQTRKVKQVFTDLHGHNSVVRGQTVNVSPRELIKKLTSRTQVDMQLYASELATDYMEAYYKVARKKLVDDIGTLAIETCLMGPLPSLFEAEAISCLDDNAVARLAQESPEAGLKRQQCAEKLAVLEAGKSEMERLDAHRALTSARHISFHINELESQSNASLSTDKGNSSTASDKSDRSNTLL